MINFTNSEKEEITSNLKEVQEKMQLSNNKFAARIGVSTPVLTYVFNRQWEKVGEAMWLKMAQYTGFERNPSARWMHAETKVSKYLFTQFDICKSKGMSAMLADCPGIGKSHCMREYERTHAEVLCIDCSVSNTKRNFVNAIAQAAGVSTKGTIQDVLDTAIYAIKLMEKPLIIMDEAGDLEPSALLQLKKLWNALELRCGFYMMGSDGFKSRIKRGVDYDKLGYTEIFSRFDKDFKHALSDNSNDRIEEFKQMTAAICKANGIEDEGAIRRIIANCFSGKKGIGDLRRVRREVLKLKMKEEECEQ